MADGRSVSDDGRAAQGEVSVLHSPARTRLVLTGEIDVGLNAALVEAVDAAMRRGLPVDLDVRAVTFMDSAAIALIARLAYQAATPPRVIEPPESVTFLLDVTKVGEVVEVVNAADADREAGEPAPTG